jgi:hypothetical protein
LVYFSGHGKLDPSGRLHLCMQDTDSTDLLSTAVSSARVSEFVDASRARNVVIVLDCCYAGAFRGGELGQAMAGPGRYVLTSCRGTQLANDATVENGTSYFTQHLVDGLLGAAADQDGDGYVTFSDLYAYVDRRLREAGKQIPQRRVDGDGDLPLAKRPLSAAAQTTAMVPGPMDTATGRGQSQAPRPGPVPSSTMVGKDATVPDTASTPDRRRTGRPRRKVMLAAAAAAVVVIGGAIAAATLLTGSSGGNPGGSTGNGGISSGSYVANGPWRLKVDDRISSNDNGCTITLTDAHSGQRIPLRQSVYGTTAFQIYQTGSFQWKVNNPECVVAAQAGPGTGTLPLTFLYGGGDTDAFAEPSRVAVHVTDYNGSEDCRITLRDPANGQVIDFKLATRGNGNDTVVLGTDGHPTAYLSDLSCTVRVSAAP